VQQTSGQAPRTWRPSNIRFAARAEDRALVVSIAVIGCLTVLLLLGYVLVRIKVVEAGYRLSVTRQLVVRLEREGRELAVRAAAADAPGRLESMAAERLGMRPPQRDEEGQLP
jgi:cell division protein FtsL